MSGTFETRRVVVVIPSHNSRRWLDKCLRGLERQGGVELTAVVVDNASTDGAPDYVRRHWPGVSLIQSDKNLGYGAGVNHGAREVPGAHVLALNADAVLQPDCLRRLLDVLEERPSVGVAAPMLVEADGRLQPSAHRFPSLSRLLGEALLLDRLGLGWAALDYHHRDYRYDRRLTVDWATGAVLLIRREAWDAVGGFDPAYFMYAEEIDLQRRIGAADWTAVLEPSARAVHHGGKRPIPPERFLLAHDGLERLLAPEGGLRAAAVRLVLILTALTRAVGWAGLAGSPWHRSPEARPWAAMFFGVAWGSLLRLPGAARRRQGTSRTCYACRTADDPSVAHSGAHRDL